MSEVNQSETPAKYPSGRHPASLAALARFQVLFPNHRRCVHCNRTALRDKPFCRSHAGGGRAKRALQAKAGRGERRILWQMDAMGLLPEELLAHPAWRAIASLPTSVRSPLRLAMVQRWDAREDAPLAFADIVRQAHQAAERVAPIAGVSWSAE